MQGAHRLRKAGRQDGRKAGRQEDRQVGRRESREGGAIEGGASPPTRSYMYTHSYFLHVPTEGGASPSTRASRPKASLGRARSEASASCAHVGRNEGRDVGR